jgi:ATP-dependent metalloprotease FtsH
VINRYLRNLVVWAILVAVVIAYVAGWPLSRMRTTQKEIDYSQFLNQATEGQIAKVTIGDETITGEYKDGTSFRTYIPNNDTSYLQMLRAKGVTIAVVPKSRSALWQGILFNMLPLLLLIGLWMWMLRQAQSGSSQAMSFGKSRARLHTENRPKVTFEDVAGVEEAKEELQEVIEFLKHPKKFQALGAKIPRGVLLVGPPGSGKTLLAKAIAGEAGVPFFSISGSEFVEMFVGVGASVDYTTSVLIRDEQGTRLTPIGEFVDTFYPNGQEGYVIPVHALQTLGYEPDTSGGFGSSAWKRVRGVYRHRTNEIYEIHYLGEVLRTTGDHSIFVRDHGGIKPKAVRELKPGDVLVNLPLQVRSEADRLFGTMDEGRTHRSDADTRSAKLQTLLQEEEPVFAYATTIARKAKELEQRTVADWARVSVDAVRHWQSRRHRSRNFGQRIPEKVPVTPIVQRVVRKSFDGYVYDLCGCDNEAFFGGEKPVLLHNSRVRDLFDQAKKSAPDILFIDEIDAVGRQRGAGLGGGHDEREQTLNQLLVEMDGFDPNAGIIIIAATNRPDILDPALLRPGRFDRRVVVDNPDTKGRRAILDVHVRGKPLGEDVDLGRLAKHTPGFSGADIANLVNEAALLAARHNKKKIAMEEMEEAIERVIAGPQRRSRILSPKEREIAAYHEAGHALLSKVLPDADPPHKVTILPRGMALGYVISAPPEDKYNYTRTELLDRITVALGGRVAEQLIFSEVTTGAQNDFEQATQLARKMVTEFGMSEKLGPLSLGKRHGPVFLGRDMYETRDYSEEIAYEIDKEVRRIIDECFERARTMIVEHRPTLERVAKALLEKESLEGEQLDRVLAGEPLGPEAPEQADATVGAKSELPARPESTFPTLKPKPEAS